MSRGGLDRFAPCEFNLEGQRHGATESTDLEFHVSIAKAYQGLMKFEQNDPIICVLWRLFVSYHLWFWLCTHFPTPQKFWRFPIVSHPGIHHLRRMMDLTGQFKAEVQRKLPLDAEFLPRSNSFRWLHLQWNGCVWKWGMHGHAGIPQKKKHVGKMDDPWWSIKFWDARFSDPNLECWAIQQNFAGDSKSQSCARCIEFGHRRVQGSKWKDRPCDTRMFVISDKDACLQVVNKFDIWTNCEKNWCSDSDADCCSRWGRCGAVSEPPCGWWQIRLGTHCLSRTSELSSHCWDVVNALNTDHFRSVASVFDILLISRIWFAPHLKLLPDVNLLKIKRIRSQIVWTVDCRLHIQIRAGLSPASIYRPYSPLSILVPLWSEPHFGRPFGASLGATLKQYF